MCGSGCSIGIRAGWSVGCPDGGGVSEILGAPPTPGSSGGYGKDAAKRFGEPMLKKVRQLIESEEPLILLDPTEGGAGLGRQIRSAAAHLGATRVPLVDVGGDIVAGVPQIR